MALGALSYAKRRGLAYRKIYRSSVSIIFRFQNFAIRRSQPSRSRADIGREAMLLCWISCMVKQLAAAHVAGLRTDRSRHDPGIDLK
jgi:hypothetical protein